MAPMSTTAVPMMVATMVITGPVITWIAVGTPDKHRWRGHHYSGCGGAHHRSRRVNHLRGRRYDHRRRGIYHWRSRSNHHRRRRQGQPNGNSKMDARLGGLTCGQSHPDYC